MDVMSEDNLVVILEVIWEVILEVIAVVILVVILEVISKVIFEVNIAGSGGSAFSVLPGGYVKNRSWARSFRR